MVQVGPSHLPALPVFPPIPASSLVHKARSLSEHLPLYSPTPCAKLLIQRH